MNTISTTGQVAAMDGPKRVNAVSRVAPVQRRMAGGDDRAAVVVPTGAEAARQIAQNIADVKKSADEMQKMSDAVMGREVQFKVNKELGSVVINVVDPNTDAVLAEIPSEEMQTLKLRMKQTMGLIFDELR